MLTLVQKRVLLYMTDDERHALDEIARVLQIAPEDVRAALHTLELLDLVGSHTRLVGGNGVEFWRIWWRRAERRK